MHVDVAVTLDLCIIYDTGVFQSPAANLESCRGDNLEQEV